jgi:hypothetical protein
MVNATTTQKSGINEVSFFGDILKIGIFDYSLN